MPERERSDAPTSVVMISHRSHVWGAQRRLFGLMPGLAERGVVFTLAAPEGMPLSEEWVGRGLPYVPLDLPVHHGLRQEDGSRRPSPRALAREAGVVATSTRRIMDVVRDADVVLSYSLNAHVETVAAARLARRPVVVEVVDLVRPGIGRRLLQAASRLASATVVNSSATAAMLGAGRADVHLIHPGVDLTRFRPGPPPEGLRAELSADPERPLVGIVGRIDPEKGVHVLVEAFTRLTRDGVDAQLVVVGEAGAGGEAYAEALQRDATGVLGERVRFTGRRQDVPDVLRGLDLLVNASHAEPFGLSVLEAQASGVAVVGTDAGGIPDFVEDGVTGLLVPPDDPGALAGALARLVGDPSLRHRLAEAGRRQAVEQFALDDQYDRRAAVYHAAASSARSRRHHRPRDSERSADATATE